MDDCTPLCPTCFRERTGRNTLCAFCLLRLDEHDPKLALTARRAIVAFEMAVADKQRVVDDIKRLFLEIEARAGHGA